MTKKTRQEILKRIERSLIKSYGGTLAEYGTAAKMARDVFPVVVKALRDHGYISVDGKL